METGGFDLIPSPPGFPWLSRYPHSMDHGIGRAHIGKDDINVVRTKRSNQKMWDDRRVNDQVRGANLGEKTEVGIDSEYIDREQKAQVMAWEVKRVNPQVHIPVFCYPCLCSSKTPCSICTETGACDLILFLFLLRRSAVPQRAKRRRMFLISR